MLITQKTRFLPVTNSGHLGVIKYNIYNIFVYITSKHILYLYQDP